MSITVYGVAGSLDVPHWSQLMQDSGDGDGGMFVASGLRVTVATGTRVLSVSEGRSLQAGALAMMNAAQTVTLAANTSGLPRIDVICMQVDFSKPSATAGTLVARVGTPAATPVIPALTQVPGGIWQTPLARIVVPADATQLLAANGTDMRPGQISTAAPVPVTTARPFVALNVPGNWAAVSAPLGVQRLESGFVEITGRLQRVGSALVPGDSAPFDNAAIIPNGYRPTRAEMFLCIGGTSANINQIVINPSGLATLYVVSGTLTDGAIFRVATTTWIGA